MNARYSSSSHGGPGSGSSDTIRISAHQGLLINSTDDNQEVEIQYTDLKTIGNGSFGVVYQAQLLRPTQEQIAIKKVLQDRRFKNRELQIMRRLDHCNVVKLKYYFHTVGDRTNQDVYLNLVLEYIPETLYKIARSHSRHRHQTFPITLIKLYMYQLFRSLNYIHSMSICHRDIKPQNLLLNPETGVLKLCDFGSAKSLVNGDPNVAYICSRYYRAPELIFGATDYTTKIDIWSAGCVMAELLLGEPMFPGDSGVDQLVEIIKVLGTPSKEQMRAMNHSYVDFRFPTIRASPWNNIFINGRTPPEASNLVSKLLEYTPSRRLTPLEACAHPFFDELRSPQPPTLSNGASLPPLFNFNDQELSREPHLASQLIPVHLSESVHSRSSNDITSTSSSTGSASATVTTTATSNTNPTTNTSTTTQRTSSTTANTITDPPNLTTATNAPANATTSGSTSSTNAAAVSTTASPATRPTSTSVNPLSLSSPNNAGQAQARTETDCTLRNE